MGIEKLLLCGIFFKIGEDIPMYGTPEMIERTRLHNSANNVGNSGFQSWLADPQPNPALATYKDGYLSTLEDSQGVTSITKDSISYSNGGGTLGGITRLSIEEVCMLCKKHFGGKD